MKRLELREFLRVTHFVAVEKDGTVWAQVAVLGTPKSEKRQQDAGVTWNKPQYYLDLLIRFK
ncbi:MAG: hypothetical protein WBE13_08475 [Candidatus Acidiferrum sp.]